MQDWRGITVPVSLPSPCSLTPQEEIASRRGLQLQVELEELLGVPLEDVLNEHQLRCSTLAESGAPHLLLKLCHQQIIPDFKKPEILEPQKSKCVPSPSSGASRLAALLDLAESCAPLLYLQAEPPPDQACRAHLLVETKGVTPCGGARACQRPWKRAS